MKMKKNIIISSIVIVLLAGYLVFNTFHIQKLVTLPKINEAITEIVITKGSEVITLTKVGDNWNVNGYDADKNVVANIENKLKSIEVTDLVSDKPHYERFELDSAHAVRVIAKASGKLVRNMYIGKKGSTYRHTYVRFEGNPSVYLVEDTLDSYFNKTVDDLRNKDIVQVDIAKINLIKLWYKNTTITLNKKIVEKMKDTKENKTNDKKNDETSQDKDKINVEKEEQWICTEYPNIGLDNNKVKEMLYVFDPLKAYSFPDIDAKTLRGRIAFIRVSLSDDDTKKSNEITLTVHKEYEANRFLCTSSKSPYVFTLDEWRAKRIFKTIQDFKK